MFQMCGVFAEFEGAMTRERVKAGLARARAIGKRLGRPRVSEAVQERVLAARSEGLSVRKIADACSLSVGKVHAIIKKAA